MASEDEDTPRARIASAVRDKPKRAYAEVFAADVVALGEQVRAHTTVTADLVTGARNALAGAKAPEELRVAQIAGQLAELVERAGG